MDTTGVKRKAFLGTTNENEGSSSNASNNIIFPTNAAAVAAADCIAQASRNGFEGMF